MGCAVECLPTYTKAQAWSLGSQTHKSKIEYRFFGAKWVCRMILVGRGARRKGKREGGGKGRDADQEEEQENPSGDSDHILVW